MKRLFSFKKNVFLMLSVALCAICFSSCIVTKTETAKVRDVAGVVVHIPTIADLDVPANRVSETFNVKISKNWRGLPIITETVKSFATAQLLKKYDADVLIEPRYSIENAVGLYKFKFNVVVSGYPAKYKNFRPMADKDAIFLNPMPPYIFPEKKTGTLILK